MLKGVDMEKVLWNFLKNDIGLPPIAEENSATQCVTITKTNFGRDHLSVWPIGQGELSTFLCLLHVRRQQMG